MLPADITRLLHPFLGDAVLSPAQIESVSVYLNLLLRWNSRINLTSVREPESILARHFGESLFAASRLFPDASTLPANEQEPATDVQISLADLGSGAGFPGIPIKLFCPSIVLTLIESNHKKCAFLREVIRTVGLEDANVVNLRAEDIADASYDILTFRAVERFDAVLSTAAGLVVPGGRLALLIGESQLDPARAALANWSWLDPLPIPLSDSRILAVARKP